MKLLKSLNLVAVFLAEESSLHIVKQLGIRMLYGKNQDEFSPRC